MARSSSQSTRGTSRCAGAIRARGQRGRAPTHPPGQRRHEDIPRSPRDAARVPHHSVPGNDRTWRRKLLLHIRHAPSSQRGCCQTHQVHKWRTCHSFLSADVHVAAMSMLNHSLNSVKLPSSLRHACMAFSHARLVMDLSRGEGCCRQCNTARRSGSTLSKYAQKELDSRMSFQASYSLVRQMASTPATRCIKRRSQSVASAIGSSHTCAAAAR